MRCYLLHVSDAENSLSCSMRLNKLLDDVTDDEVEMYTRNYRNFKWTRLKVNSNFSRTT